MFIFVTTFYVSASRGVFVLYIIYDNIILSHHIFFYSWTFIQLGILTYLITF